MTEDEINELVDTTRRLTLDEVLRLACERDEEFGPAGLQAINNLIADLRA